MNARGAWLLAFVVAMPAGAGSLPEQRFPRPGVSARPADRSRRIRLLSATPEIKSYLKTEFGKLGLPGLAAGVVFGGERIWSLGLGVRNLETREPVTPDTVFRTGSVTKTFTGLALLHLRDAGKLSLDDPVAKFVPEIERVIYPTQDSPRITLRHLVTHSSGLPRMAGLDYTRPDREVTETELLAALEGTELGWSPGVRSEYSNLAMGVAGLVVERVSGMRFRDFVTARLLRPLGMHASAWDRRDVPAARLATGYRLRDAKFMTGPHWRFGAAEALGGLYASLADMGRYTAFQLQAWPPRSDPDGGPVRRSTLRESHRVAGFGHPGDQSFGVNWAVLHHPKLGFSVTHTGGTFLYGAVVWMLPERGLGVVLLANSGGENGEAAYRLSDMAAGMLDILLRHDPEPGVVVSRPVRDMLERVYRLMLTPERSAVEAAFSPRFLEAVPADKLIRLLEDSGRKLGACPHTQPLRLLGRHAAVVLAKCEKGSAELTLYLDDEQPRRISGFSIKLVGK